MPNKKYIRHLIEYKCLMFFIVVWRRIFVGMITSCGHGVFRRMTRHSVAVVRVWDVSACDDAAFGGRRAGAGGISV